jgi:hypothetical protein
LDKAKKEGNGLEATMSSLGKVAMVAGAAGIAAVGVEAVKMADKFDTAQAQLKTAVNNSGSSFDKLQPKIAALSEKMSGIGFNSTDVESSLASLTTAADNPTKAMGLMGLAADLARQKGVSLGTATGALTKLLGGSTRALSQMGINLDIGSGKLASIQSATNSVKIGLQALKTTQDEIAAGTIKGAVAQDELSAAHARVSQAEDHLKISQDAISKSLDALQSRTKGAASAFAGTLGGQLEVMKAKVDNLGVSFGEKLIPVLEHTMNAVADVVKWFEKHKAIAEALGIAIGTVLTLAVATYVKEVGTKMVTAIQKSFSSLGKLADMWHGAGDAASDSALATDEAATDIEASSEAAGLSFESMLGPIGLVIIAATEIATHWKTVEGWLKDAWNGIKNAAITVWDFIKSHLSDVIEAIVILFTGGLGLLPVLIYRYWNQISSGVTTVWDAIVSFIESIPSRILSALSALGSDLLSLATTAWGLFKSGVTTVVGTVLSFVKGIPGKILDLFKDAGQWLLDAGKAIIQGLVNGIKAGFHLVSDAVNDVVGLVKHIPIIGGLIGSPSPYFTEVGHAIGQGLTNGITASTGGALSALRQTASTLQSVPFHLGPTGSMAASLAGGTSNAAALAGAGSSGSSLASSLPPMALTVQLHVDGQQLASVLLPDIRTGFLQQKRAIVNLGMS